MAVGVAVLGAAVLVGAWNAGAALAPADGSISPKLLAGKAGESVGLSV